DRGRRGPPPAAPTRGGAGARGPARAGRVAPAARRSRSLPGGGAGPRPASGEPARGRRAAPVRRFLLPGDRRAAGGDRDGGQGSRPPRVRAAARPPCCAPGAARNAHQRFLAHLAADTLDDADRSHAAECRGCGALLPRSEESSPPAALEPIRARALEALRTSPVRPWWQDALLLAGLNAVVALGA